MLISARGTVCAVCMQASERFCVTVCVYKRLMNIGWQERKLKVRLEKEMEVKEQKDKKGKERDEKLKQKEEERKQKEEERKMKDDERKKKHDIIE